MRKIVCAPDQDFFHPSSVHTWTSAFRLDVHWLCVAIEGKFIHFVSCWLRTDWQSVISQGKIPLKYPTMAGSLKININSWGSHLVSNTGSQ